MKSEFTKLAVTLLVPIAVSSSLILYAATTPAPRQDPGQYSPTVNAYGITDTSQAVTTRVQVNKSTIPIPIQNFNLGEEMMRRMRADRTLSPQAKAVRPNIQDDSVTLEGVVMSQEERLKLGAIALELAPNRALFNRLVVVSTPSP